MKTPLPSNPPDPHYLPDSLYPLDCIESLNAWIDDLNAQWDAAHPNWTSDLFQEVSQKETLTPTRPYPGAPQIPLPTPKEATTLTKC